MSDAGESPLARGAIRTAEHITLTPTDEELKHEKRRARQLVTAHERKAKKDTRIAEALVMETITIPNLELQITGLETNAVSFASSMASKDTEITALLARVTALEEEKRLSGEHVERLEEAVKDAGKAEEHKLRWRYDTSA
jgi:chromosome segregation ATPase